MKLKAMILIPLVLILTVSAGSARTAPAGQQQNVPDPAQAIQVPEPYVDAIKASQAYLELTLNDAIRLALANNLEIQIEDFNEELNRERITGTKGFFDPVLTFRAGWNSNQRPNTRVLDGAVVSLNKRWTFNTSVRQNVPFGGNLTVNWNNGKSTTNDSFTFINPNYSSGMSINFTQPLWRGFKETQTRRQLKLQNLDSEISDSQFQQRVSTIIQQVENQYWELAYSIENYEARRRSLSLALVQHEDNRKRVEIGVLAPIEITSSLAESATREQEMIQSEVDIIRNGNALKRLLAPDPNASLWDLVLIPTGQPEVQDLTMSMDDAIQAAIEHRPELDQLRLQLERNEVDRSYYRKNGKPRFDLTFGLSSNGTSGDVIESGGGDQNPFNGNFWLAARQAALFDFPNWNVTVDVEIPLRNRANDANLAQVAINERVLNSRIRNQQQGIIVEVRDAYQSIQTQRKRLNAARVAARLSQEQLNGETKRFEAGLSTNFEVLRLQRDLTDAHLRELRAVVDYQQSLTALRTATFTIIGESDIILAKREK